MKEPKILFQGDVRVYLQGRNALFPFDLRKIEQMKYYLGSIKTRLIVKDKRKKTLRAARRIISGKKNVSFANYFNTAANIKIIKNYRGIVIEMDEVVKKNNARILWMGVLYENKMPVHRITWHILKAIDENTTAFAAIVED